MAWSSWLLLLADVVSFFHAQFCRTMTFHLSLYIVHLHAVVCNSTWMFYSIQCSWRSTRVKISKLTINPLAVFESPYSLFLISWDDSPSIGGHLWRTQSQILKSLLPKKYFEASLLRHFSQHVPLTTNLQLVTVSRFGIWLGCGRLMILQTHQPWDPIR